MISKWNASGKQALEYCKLDDLGFIGPKFTWTRKRTRGTIVRCRLDRVLVNEA